ncbi:MAG TPA: prolipoprotein diacylglyceryl transferase [Fimbriimonadaceae bacterium]|nr:prolipoprotein diacylglyceryl transferase [Fimbriimonadaceae bacterium]HRJ96282.1 prolipoprotein diacylglyceryl transferase [Fimbriimonadaceae bacterium]
MCPVLFHIGSFPVRSFGLVLIVGFLVGIWMARRRASRFGLDGDKLWDLAILLIVFGVLGSRLAFIVQEWDHFSRNTKEIYSLQFDGLTSFGGIILGLIVMVIWTRRTKTSFLSAMDVFAVPFLVASAIGRFGCLMNGCCFGGPTDLPWGVHFVDVPGVHHPAQIYDSLMCLAGAGLIAWTERRRLASGASLVPGRSMSLMFLAYGISRFIYEFWRAGQSSTYWGSLPITQAQAVAGLLALVGLTLYFVLGRRGRPSPHEAPA